MSEQGQQQTPAAPLAGSLAADPAFAKFDAETQGAFKNHGWDAKTPAEAAYEALKSYREAEKFVGIPKDQIVRLPKDATDAEGWKAFNKRIGVPEEPKGYDFSGVKFADGTALDDGFVDTMRNAFHGSGIPADKAPAIAQTFVKFLEGAEADDTAAATAKLAVERDALAKNWGANAETNKFIVKQAVAKLGLNEEIVNTIESAAGYKATMEAFLKIGQMMGEDKFVQSPTPGRPGIMSADQAAARLAELKADSFWVAKLNKGDVKANEEFDNLTRLIATSGV